MDLFWSPNIKEYPYTRPFGDDGWLMTIEHYDEICKIHDPVIIHHSYTFVVRIHTSWKIPTTNQIDRSALMQAVTNKMFWCRHTTCGCKIPPQYINDPNWIDRPCWLITNTSDQPLSQDILKKVSAEIYPETVSKTYDLQFQNDSGCLKYRYSYACRLRA